MAKLGDLVRVHRSVGLWTLIKRVVNCVSADNVLTHASALAYSWLFSIFPFFIFLLALLPYLPEQYRSTADERISASVHQSLPKETAEVIDANLARLLENPQTGLLSIGIAITIWGASGGMAATMFAIDQCYSVKTTRPFWIQRPLAILLTVIVATLILAVLILLPITTTLINFVTDWEPFVKWLSEHPTWQKMLNPILIALNFVRWIIALLLMFAALSVIYYFSPSIKQTYHFITPGAVFCVIVWILLGAAFRLYVDKYGKYDQTYGTLGGVVILLFLFYMDAAVLLVGAEINSEIDFIVLDKTKGETDFREPEDPSKQKDEAKEAEASQQGIPEAPEAGQV